MDPRSLASFVILFASLITPVEGEGEEAAVADALTRDALRAFPQLFALGVRELDEGEAGDLGVMLRRNREVAPDIINKFLNILELERDLIKRKEEEGVH